MTALPDITKTRNAHVDQSSICTRRQRKQRQNLDCLDVCLVISQMHHANTHPIVSEYSLQSRHLYGCKSKPPLVLGQARGGSLRGWKIHKYKVRRASHTKNSPQWARSLSLSSLRRHRNTSTSATITSTSTSNGNNNNLKNSQLDQLLWRACFCMSLFEPAEGPWRWALQVWHSEWSLWLLILYTPPSAMCMSVCWLARSWWNTVLHCGP